MRTETLVGKGASSWDHKGHGSKRESLTRKYTGICAIGVEYDGMDRGHLKLKGPKTWTSEGTG